MYQNEFYNSHFCDPAFLFYLYFFANRYYLEDTEKNSRNYLELHKINASEQVMLLAASAERLSVQLQSKM